MLSLRLKQTQNAHSIRHREIAGIMMAATQVGTRITGQAAKVGGRKHYDETACRDNSVRRLCSPFFWQRPATLASLDTQVLLDEQRLFLA